MNIYELQTINLLALGLLAGSLAAKRHHANLFIGAGMGLAGAIGLFLAWGFVLCVRERFDKSSRRKKSSAFDLLVIALLSASAMVACLALARIVFAT